MPGDDNVFNTCTWSTSPRTSPLSCVTTQLTLLLPAVVSSVLRWARTASSERTARWLTRLPSRGPPSGAPQQSRRRSRSPTPSSCTGSPSRKGERKDARAHTHRNPILSVQNASKHRLLEFHSVAAQIFLSGGKKNLPAGVICLQVN